MLAVQFITEINFSLISKAVRFLFTIFLSKKITKDACPGRINLSLQTAFTFYSCELSHKHLFIFNVAKVIKYFCCLHGSSYSEGTRNVLSFISVK